MRVGIFGSWDWQSYPDIMRHMTLFIQESHELNHSEIIFVHTGAKGAENMVTEYIGKTEKFLKEKHFKIKESIIRGTTQVVKDMEIIESGIDFSIIFSTGCNRTKACARLLKEYNIPFRVIESS